MDDGTLGGDVDVIIGDFKTVLPVSSGLGSLLNEQHVN